ncbi:hypothetical protein FHT82_004371 [Rhizobium sp. BK275]|uniref:hypothetical protein n=1 Tax=Rhizobium sp. BK275 TaxID=2587077 RepID=UPI00162016D7|nr:hypothetical protein [Rhizobium sp. BK275]MBB3391593.1 hypothetical protein [Rhizobium sp. BK275]
MGVTHAALPELALRRGITTSVQSPACEMPECRSSCQHFGQKASGNIVAWFFALREMVTIQMVGGALAYADARVSLWDTTGLQPEGGWLPTSG